jgi:hypothetical protein
MLCSWNESSTEHILSAQGPKQAMKILVFESQRHVKLQDDIKLKGNLQTDGNYPQTFIPKA